MSADGTDRIFTGSVPQAYQQYTVPLIFEPFAIDLAHRVAAFRPASVLELAAGTGVVTRELAKALPPAAGITATDLSGEMLEVAAAMTKSRTVTWQRADAMALPFPDHTFDAVVCQFGAMFFPDKAKAFSEVKRVLRPGGVFLFNVWDRIEENDFTDVFERTLAELFPADPPRFMSRIPQGYHVRGVIENDLARVGELISFETIAKRSRADSARMTAVAFCQGTPLRGEIEARDSSRLEEATDATEQAIEARFGRGPVEGRIQAHVMTVRCSVE